MQTDLPPDSMLRQLLQPLLGIRHPHLSPLTAVRADPQGLSLVYGEPGPCGSGCDGVAGAVAAVHAVGLWVGALLPGLRRDGTGRVVVTGVGASWDLSDPFAGHPSAGDHDLRIRWRQAGDLHGLAGLADLAYCR